MHPEERTPPLPRAGRGTATRLPGWCKRWHRAGGGCAQNPLTLGKNEGIKAARACPAEGCGGQRGAWPSALETDPLFTAPRAGGEEEPAGEQAMTDGRGAQPRGVYSSCGRRTDRAGGGKGRVGKAAPCRTHQRQGRGDTRQLAQDRKQMHEGVRADGTTAPAGHGRSGGLGQAFVGTGVGQCSATPDPQGCPKTCSGGQHQVFGTRCAWGGLAWAQSPIHTVSSHPLLGTGLLSSPPPRGRAGGGGGGPYSVW